MAMTDTNNVTRRTTLTGLGAMILGSGAATSSVAANDDWMTDPRKILDTYIRMQGDVSGKVCPWRFHGYVLGVARDEPARILFACEGAETKKIFLREDGFEMWSKVMTMFKDPDSGEVLSGKSWKNPFTGMMNTVQPNVIGSKTLLRVSDSGAILTERSINGSPAQVTELTMDFIVLGDKVQIDAHRNPPRQWPAETAVFATNTAELAHILDPGRPRIEATFSGSDVVPWQKFMEMPPSSGHAVWHTNGRKMRGFAELSPEYLEQARLHIPDVLEWAKL
jgi:hypothetical protein